MTIAEQLLRNKSDLDTINTAVADQEELVKLLQDVANSLPELPVLTSPGNSDHLVAGKQLLDVYGNIVTGTLELAEISYDYETGTLTISE